MFFSPVRRSVRFIRAIRFLSATPLQSIFYFSSTVGSLSGSFDFIRLTYLTMATHHFSTFLTTTQQHLLQTAKGIASQISDTPLIRKLISFSIRQDSRFVLEWINARTHKHVLFFIHWAFLSHSSDLFQCHHHWAHYSLACFFFLLTSILCVCDANEEAKKTRRQKRKRPKKEGKKIEPSFLWHFLLWINYTFPLNNSRNVDRFFPLYLCYFVLEQLVSDFNSNFLLLLLLRGLYVARVRRNGMLCHCLLISDITENG